MRVAKSELLKIRVLNTFQLNCTVHSVNSLEALFEIVRWVLFEYDLQRKRSFFEP